MQEPFNLGSPKLQINVRAWLQLQLFFSPSLRRPGPSGFFFFLWARPISFLLFPTQAYPWVFFTRGLGRPLFPSLFFVLVSQCGLAYHDPMPGQSSFKFHVRGM